VKEELTGPSLDVEESLGVVRNATASEAIAIIFQQWKERCKKCSE
jgi:hypothetical protein